MTEIGLASLRVVDVKISVEKALNCALPTTLLFDYPTVESLVNYLADEVLALDTVPPVSHGGRDSRETETTSRASVLAALTEAELASLLAKELADTSLEKPR